MMNTFVSRLHRNLFSGVLAISAFASTSYAVAQDVIRVNVPFAFQNGSQQLPAGAYNIDLHPGHVVQIRDRASNASGFAMARPEQRSKAFDTGKVVFHKYGEHIYLSEIWLANETMGYKCTTSRAEKRDQQQLQVAANTTVPSNVEVALNEIR